MLLYVVCDVWKKALSRILAITERSDMSLYEEPMFMLLLYFGMGITFANFHVCGMILLFNAMLYMLVRYRVQEVLCVLGA